MPFDWTTFALQTVNFAILVWLLHRFLYRPVLRVIDQRRTEIAKQYADAAAAEAAATTRLAEIETERAGIAAERDAVLQHAAAQAQDAAAARRAEGEREAAALLDEARKGLAAERQGALAEARNAAIDFGAEIARRLLAEIPAPLRTEAWLDRIECHLAEATSLEKEALVGQLVNGARLEVVTPAALPVGSAETWRARLQRALGTGIAIDFDVDPGLVAGAELHFPNAVLRFSCRDALDAIRADIRPNDKSR